MSQPLGKPWGIFAIRSMLPTYLHNFAQRVAELSGSAPIDCHYYQPGVSKSIFCHGCEPGSTFKCQQCHRLTSWCKGRLNHTLYDSCWLDSRERMVKSLLIRGSKSYNLFLDVINSLRLLLDKWP